MVYQGLTLNFTHYR